MTQRQPLLLILSTGDDVLDLIWQFHQDSAFLTPDEGRQSRTLRDVCRRLNHLRLDLRELAAGRESRVVYGKAFFARFSPVLNTFDWGRFGALALRQSVEHERMESPTGTFYIANGSHRALALVWLVERGEVDFRPVPAYVLPRPK